MKKIFAVAVIAAASSAAFAQSGNFTGWSGGVNLDLAHSSSKLTDQANGSTVDGFGKGTTGASARAGYGFATSSTGIVTVGMSYNLTSPEIFNQQDSDGSYLKGKLKSSYALFVEPGTKLTDNTLLYGKISYEKSKLEASSDGGMLSKSISGMGYGFGVRTMLDKQMYLQVEVKRIGFSTKAFDEAGVDFQPSSTIGSVGIGWRF